jgi:ubiquitin conjugation factor E4 B
MSISNISQQPQSLDIFERHLKRFKDQLEKTRCLIEAVKGVLLDDQIQARSMLLMRYVITWLLRIVQPGSNYPKTPIKLPLAEQPSATFACLPEYLLEDIVDNFKFVTSHMPQVIQDTQCEELVTVCVTFLRSPDYVKNPYLKAGLVSILFHGVYPWGRKPKGTLGDLLCSSEFCHRHLLHALMNFYIEAESTGGHNQFYDKFNIRYEIFQVIRCIWGSATYRKNLENESKVNVDFFVRFVNLLMNDVTYVMGEAFRAFQEIHVIQDQLGKPDDLDETQRKEKEEQLEQLQRQARGNMQLTNETVSMLKLFTEVLAGPFTMPEIVQRLADMLDYNLEQMVGPKQGQLRVKDQHTYHFNPKALLSDLMSVFLNLGTQPSFLLAVARDGRSYKPEIFEQALRIMVRAGLKSPEELNSFRRLAKKIAQVHAADQQEEEELGEIPDEFLDPITADLMKDPVTLPSSRQVLDRDSIRAMLLNDPIDPFNRMPLKIEDVIPNDELKAKIQAFKDEAKARKLKAVQEDIQMEENEAVEENDAEEEKVETMDLS